MQVYRESGPPTTVHDLGGSGQALLFAPANGFHGLCYRSVVRPPSLTGFGTAALKLQAVDRAFVMQGD